MKKKIIDYIIILIFSLIVSIPLVSQDLNIYNDDGLQHIARLMGTYQSITEGEFPPVIMSNFCNGFGYSWNIFYSPFTAYIPLIFSIFTSSFELVLKLFILLLSFITGIAMYEFVKRVTKNRYAGIIAAVIYMFAPYRLTDIYMRVAISELASFIFLPITFLGMYNIFNSEEKSIKKSLLLTVGAVGLILTHIVIAMYAAIICFIYMLINIKKLKDKQVWKMIGINLLLIILLTSFYLLPILEHMMTTDYEVFQDGRMITEEKLVLLKVELVDLLYTKQGNLSYEIGLVSLIGLVLSLLAYKKIDKEYKKLYWFALGIGIICIIMSLSFFPFERLPSIFKMIQFSFRLLEFSSFFFAFIAATNYSLIIKNFNMRDVLVLSLITILLVVPLKKNLNYEKKWSEDKLWPAVSVTESTGSIHAGCATFEYLPSKAYNNLSYIIQREDKAYILAGNAIIENENKNGTNMTFNISNVEENTIIELPYIYYLGYTVEFINSDEERQRIDTFESNNGFVAIEIVEGMEGRIEISYTGTTLMIISYVISFGTLFGLLIIVISKKIWKKRKS